jgi:hypothetical protein
MSDPNIRIKRSAVPGKRPTVEQLPLGELALNTYDAELFARRERAGIGTDIVRVGAGVTVTNILYVTKDGSDTNSGKKLGDAKATIKAAVSAATEGSVIRVAAGTYIEDNPIKLPPQVSIVGDSLREVSVTPLNSGEDLFHVSPGNYITEMSFTGTMTGIAAIAAFNPTEIRYFNQSPYIRNCTNFIQNSIGLRIDGRHALGPIKSMVTDSFTQYNQGGIGISITNEGYAQLVSLFTICNDIAVFCGSGGACDLTNSNSSFGNYALVADGIGPRKYTGVIANAEGPNSDTFIVDLSVPTYGISTAVYDNVTGLTTITTSTNHDFTVGMGVSLRDLLFTCVSTGTTALYPSGNNGDNSYVFDVKSVPAANQFTVNVGISTTPDQVYVSGGTVKTNIMRPFDGQVVYFGDLFYTVGEIVVSSGGTGYTGNADVTISSPSTSNDWGVPAQAVAEVKNGSVVNIELVSSGRGYTSVPTVTISAPGVGVNTATATAKLVPTYYSIQSCTPVSPSGICTVTLTDNVPFAVGVGTTVPFFKQSRVLASGHSLEYIGTGTDIDTAFPSTGGVPIQDNEVDMRNGGLVVYTSTDQSGNFRIGDGVVVNQQTGTISGTFYSKSLFSTLTPFILALGE